MSDWKVYKLGDCIDSKNQGINTTTEKVEYSNTGFRIIQAKNIQPFSYDFDKTNFISESNYSKIKEKFKPCKGDILYTNIGSQLGNAAIFGKRNISCNCIITWNVLKLVTNNEILMPEYLCYWLNMNRERIRNLNSSSTMPFVSGDALLLLDIPVPPISEQKKMISIFNLFDEKINLLNYQIFTLEQMSETLFRKWIIGHNYYKK
jgi:type I restriction enzyme S subunit